jgi:hypothetical protein
MAHYHELIEKTGGAMPSEIGANRTKAGTLNALAVALYKHDVSPRGWPRLPRVPGGGVIDRFREFKMRIPIYSGRVFRREAGHRSEMKPAAIPINFRPGF